MPTLRWVVILVLACVNGSTLVAKAVEDAKIVPLWSVAQMTVPAGIYVSELDKANLCLCFGTYLFYSNNRRAVVLTANYDSLDSEDGSIGFLSADQISASKKILVNGLTAWMFDNGLDVDVNIKLPTVKHCTASGKEYALLVYAHGDVQAAALAATFRPKQPYPCLTVMP